MERILRLALLAQNDKQGDGFFDSLCSLRMTSKVTDSSTPLRFAQNDNGGDI